jgi:TetR/AcrR family transcriptional regulator
MRAAIEGDLKTLVDEKSQVLQMWMEAGRIAPMHPVHLIFSIWALTQHYADFDVQVRAMLGPGHDPFVEAGAFMETLFARLLAPTRGCGPDVPLDASATRV